MNLKNLRLVIGFLTVGLSACQPAKQDSRSGSVQPADVITTELKDSADTWVRPTDCRANISHIICEVDPKTQPFEDRACQGGEAKYIPILEKIYDSLDPINQKMFCSLRFIYIERNFIATAYASTVYKKDASGNIVSLPGSILGFRKAYLDLAPDFSTWATWKDQLNFTEIKMDLDLPLKFPRFTAGPNNPSFLTDVVIHEFGHMFDFANGLTAFKFDDENCEVTNRDQLEKCPYHFVEKNWGSMVWKNFFTVKTEYDFLNRDRLCFYMCKTRMNPETDLLSFYQGLGQSVFVSTYAASNVMDDWAESWAVHWMLEKNQDFEINASADYSFKASDIVNSPKFAERKKYMDHFLSSEIKYP